MIRSVFTKGTFSNRVVLFAGLCVLLLHLVGLTVFVPAKLAMDVLGCVFYAIGFCWIFYRTFMWCEEHPDFTFFLITASVTIMGTTGLAIFICQVIDKN